MSKLEGKVALITGSSRGIGYALAETLAKKGVKIVLNGRNVEQLNLAQQKLAEKGYNCHAVACDISSYDSCTALIEQTINHYGQLDILINNAGIAMEGTIEETNPEVFKSVFEINILGVLYPTKAALPYIKMQHGSIITTGSIAGFMGLPEYSAYSSSKMALTALSQSLRLELAVDGVHVALYYVGFAKNDPDKTFLNKEGEIEKMPTRQDFTRMPLEQVAAIFVRGIEQRRDKIILSGLGKMTNIAQRFFPNLFEWLMKRQYLKKKGAGKS